MTYTYKITTAFVGLALLATAAVVFGAQTVSAQEAFDAPPPEENRPVRAAPIKALQQKAQEVRKEAQGDIRDLKEKRDEFRGELLEKRDNFRDRAVETRDGFRDEAKDNRAELRSNAEANKAEIKAELEKAETPEERQAILEAARQQRDEMRKEALGKRDEFRDRAKEMRSNLKDQRDKFKADIKTEAGERIKGHLEGIMNRIANALEGFTSILDRVNNKLAELEANGADTIAAARASAAAEQAIQDASATLAEARALFQRVLESEAPREHVEEMKAAVRSASESVKDAHKALKTAIEELKKLIRANSDSTDE